MDDDSDIICLSSDTDEENDTKMTPTGGITKEKPSSVKLPGIDVNTAARNGHSSNNKVPCTSTNGGGSQIPTEVILDAGGNKYEIEYPRTVRKGGYETANEVGWMMIESDDEEIQVLNENAIHNVPGKKKRAKVARSKSRIEKQEGIPGSSSGCSSLLKCDLKDEFSDESETKKAIALFLKEVNKICSKAHYQKIQLKIWKRYDKVKGFAQPIQRRIQDEIRNATNTIVEFPRMLFTTVKMVLDLMEPGTVASLKEIKPDDRELQRSEQRRILTEKCEKQLRKICNKIKALDEVEVDFDSENEHNSSYILREKYKKKLMSSYYRMCSVLNCSHFTDRPTQKKIILRKHGVSSDYPEIDAEVETFLNQKGYQFIPDFLDIEMLIKRTNRSKELGLHPSDISKTAKFIFTAVVKIIKRRRAKDFELGIVDATGASVVLDPADNDEELRKKLEANEKLRKTESDVVNHFAKLAQEQEGDAESVADENEEDDNEDDEDESDAVLEAALNAELTEDEDDDSVLENGAEYGCNVDLNGNSNLVSVSSTQVETEEPEPMTQRQKEQSNEGIKPSPSLSYVEKNKNCSKSDITEPRTKRLRSDVGE